MFDTTVSKGNSSLVESKKECGSCIDAQSFDNFGCEECTNQNANGKEGNTGYLICIERFGGKLGAIYEIRSGCNLFYEYL
ncbi:hypothetical protein C5167_050040 [Papaver somniferum]|uniref:Uncharacterized protein n=1 Tax=Papaver somniferum TaxID=3469 RepID=A0A4Y7KR15_PAPSO|nr:hypothetical protein C5167_050040 [Papaver somniferum]